MTTAPASKLADINDRQSWLPMVVIAMGQALMSFNVAAIPISMSGMVKSFETPPTTIGTAIVMYSLGVSGFVMLGAKLGQRFGSKIFFQAATALFLVAMILMVISPRAEIMLAAQALAGFAGASLVPSLVALIANHYSGKQQAEAVGWLGSARAIAGVLAFIIVGYVATINWRFGFGLLIFLSVAILFLSTKLKTAKPRPEVKIDVVGVILSAIGVICIAFGFNNVRGWGLITARPAAPFDIMGLSPAIALIIGGILIVSTFFVWSHRQAIMGKTPLLALQVVSSPREWATIVALFIIVSMEGAINFTVPLYIQIVQGQSSIRSSIAMMPFMLTVFFTAILIVRLYSKFSPRRIAIASFVLVSIGTAWLAFVIRNEWSTVPVIAGLITVGLGQGALVTLLFNVLVTAAPKELAGDVGSLRGVTQNLAAAVGTALVGAFVVGMLSSMIMTNAATSPVISAELLNQVNPANLNFMTDTQVESRLTDIGASAAEVTDGLRINAEARIRALKIGFMVMSGLALLAIVPCSWLPDYKPGDIPADGQKRS
jgi:MFS family permease